MMHGERLGAVREKSREAHAHVAEKSSRRQPAETHRDLRLEAEAHGVEERRAVDDARVDGARPAGEQVGERAAAGTRDAEVAAEAVARAAGDEAEDGISADERGGDFVHRAVATDGDDQLATLGEGLRGELGRVPRALGRDDGGVEPLRGNEALRPSEEMGIAAIGAGVGIEDETNLHSERAR